MKKRVSAIHCSERIRKHKSNTLKLCIIILCAMILIVPIAACGAGGDSAGYATTRPMSTNMSEVSMDSGHYDSWDDADYEYEKMMMAQEPMPMPAPAEAPADGAYGMGGDSYSIAEEAGYDTNSGGITPISAPVTEGLAEKIIYSYYADIETREFDNSISEVEKLILSHDAFIENSNISGTNYAASYYGGSNLRYAYFRIRVPVSNLNSITAKLGNIGNVISQSSNAENITAQFTDTQSRLNALHIQEDRLLDMLSKAEDVADLIAIEERLSEVRYQLEWHTTTLNNWQRQVDYSTLSINISEVEVYTEPNVPHRTYWERMGDGIVSTLNGIGRFFMNLFMWIVTSAPVLIILALAAVAVVVIVRVNIRKAKAKKNRLQANYYASQQPTDTQPVQTPTTTTEQDTTD